MAEQKRQNIRNKSKTTTKQNPNNKNYNSKRTSNKSSNTNKSHVIVNKNPQQAKTEPILHRDLDIMNIEISQDELIKNILDEVEHFLKHEIYIAADYKIVCAVSGGVDSVSLLDAIYLISQKIRFSVYVVHFNHKLRGESADRDEKFVESLAKKYGLQFYKASSDVRQYADKNKISIEYAARRLRYNFYERITRSIGADFLATGHNADDSAETFLINLFRGSGLTGLKGIPPKRQLVKNVMLVRPFNHLRKQDIIEYAKRRSLRWRNDESNSLIEFTRNKIRRNLIPHLESDYAPAIVEVINRTSKLISGADEIIEEIVKTALPHIVTNVDNESFSLKLNILESHSRFIQGELLQASLSKYFRILPQSMNTIDRLLALKDSETGSIVEMSGNLFAVKDREYITFAKKTPAFDFHQIIDKQGEFIIGKNKLILSKVTKKQLDFNEDPNIEYFDYDKITPFMEVRSWQSGDIFKPLGMQGRMPVSDFLTNNKVSHVQKKKILLLTNKKDIIWIMGMRINEDYKINSETKRYLKAELITTK